MKKSIWRSFKFGKGTCLRQDKRCVKGANRTAAQKRASFKRKKR
jgi:hypothetical protein